MGSTKFDAALMSRLITTSNAMVEVWAESQFLSVGNGGEGCVHDASLYTAMSTCAIEGARLCTLSEIQAACTAGTGCQHDGDLIWTSAECGSGSGQCGATDLDGDGHTGFQDLLIVLSAWGNTSCEGGN